MAIVTDSRLQETFSLALEQRSKGYQDLVSNSNAILSIMKSRGGWKPYDGGPTIRERLLYNETGSYIRYSGYDFLNPLPAELINDAEFTPKMAAVSVVLTGEEILKNSGKNQLMNVMTVHMEAAEQELQDRFVEDLHSAGAETNQIGGLQKAIPTTTNSGTYGGISRVDYSIWRTTTYDANSLLGETAVTSSTIMKFFDYIMFNRSRGTRGPSVIVSSVEHYSAYAQALQGIQQIHNASDEGVKGFTHLMYAGNGKRVPVVAETGIGSAMPSNVSYFIDMKSLMFRVHSDRNFTAFGGKLRPVNQDAIVQHIGFMGELTMNNPLHMVKLYDSTP